MGAILKTFRDSTYRVAGIEEKSHAPSEVPESLIALADLNRSIENLASRCSLGLR